MVFSLKRIFLIHRHNILSNNEIEKILYNRKKVIINLKTKLKIHVQHRSRNKIPKSNQFEIRNTN